MSYVQWGCSLEMPSYSAIKFGLFDHYSAMADASGVAAKASTSALQNPSEPQPAAPSAPGRFEHATLSAVCAQVDGDADSQSKVFFCCCCLVVAL